MATVLTPEALARQRESLFNQQQQASIQQAQQSAMAQRAQLSQSLSAARQDYESARLQAQEGFYQRNRDVLTATSMRGLADSGQANIAEVQSQTAYGETLSGLYGQKQAVEQQAVQQRQIIEQSVAAATTEANLQRGRQQLQSDTQLFQEVQAIDDNKKAQIANLISLAIEKDETGQTRITQNELEQLAKAYGIEAEDLTTVMNAATYFDPSGQLTFRDKWDWSNILETTLAGAAAGAAGGATLGATAGTVVPGLGNIVGAGVGAIGGAIIGAIGGLGVSIGLEATGEAGTGFMGTSGVRRVRTSSGQNIEGTSGEILTQVRQLYAGQPGADQIIPNFDGNKIVFIYNGQKYNTFNEARRDYDRTN